MTESVGALPGTVARIASERMSEDPDHTALVVDGRQRLTLGDWDSAARAVSAGLHARGVRRADRVALLCPPDGWIDYAVTTLALYRLGAAAVPMPTGLPAGEPLRRMRHCAVSGLVRPAGVAEVCPGGWTATVAELARGGTAAPEDAALPEHLSDILYTSGTTTGSAKPVAVSHANLAHGRTARGRFTGGAPGALCGVPVGTNAAHSALMLALTSPLTVHLLTAPGPEEIAAAAVGAGVGTVVLPPHALRRWAATEVHRRHDLSCLSQLVLGSAPVPAAAVSRLSRALPELRMLAGYGSTECAPAFLNKPIPAWCEHRDPELLTRPPLRGLGSPADGTEVRVADQDGRTLRAGELGEICLRHPAPRRAYYGRPADTARVFTADGWTRTGDLGHMDGDGLVHFFDRAAHVITRDGERVSSARVEDALLWHHDVLDAAVFGLPRAGRNGGAQDGELVVAAVVTGRPVAPKLLRDFVADRLPEDHRPDRVLLVDELPYGDLGKVLKWRLRQHHMA